MIPDGKWSNGMGHHMRLVMPDGKEKPCHSFSAVPALVALAVSSDPKHALRLLTDGMPRYPAHGAEDGESCAYGKAKSSM